MSLREHAARIEQVLPQAHTVLFHRNQIDPLAHHSVGQVRLMRALMTGPKSASELGRILGLSPSSLTQMTNRMISARLVAKESDGHDRRVRMLSLTLEGSSLMQQRREARIEEAARVLETMPADRREQLIELLEQVATARPEPVAEVAH